MYVVRRLKNNNYQYLSKDSEAVDLIDRAWRMSKESAIMSARYTYGAWHAIDVSVAYHEAFFKTLHETKLRHAGNQL